MNLLDIQRTREYQDAPSKVKDKLLNFTPLTMKKKMYHANKHKQKIISIVKLVSDKEDDP